MSLYTSNPMSSSYGSFNTPGMSDPNLSPFASYGNFNNGATSPGITADTNSNSVMAGAGNIGGGASSPVDYSTLGSNVSGLGQLAQGIGGLYNTFQGNQANQNNAQSLMGMYNSAGTQAQPSVNAVNTAISNPQSYFNSPLYQSQAALASNNFNAGKNAAGTNGNNVDLAQKMTGFAAQNYNNYVNTMGTQAQGFLGNQAKYGQDYALGTTLSNQSRGTANGQYLNQMGLTPGSTGQPGGAPTAQSQSSSNMLGSLGGLAGSVGSALTGIPGLGSIGSSIGNVLGSIF